MIEILNKLCDVVVIVWLAAHMLGDFTGRPVFRAVCRELHPFVPPAALVYYATRESGWAHMVVETVVLIITAWAWWYDQTHDDDDRWRRRARGAAGLIRLRVRRLVVTS